MSRPTSFVCVLLMLTLSALPAPAAAQTPGASAPVTTTAAAKFPARILFIGGVPSMYLDGFFPQLAASGDPPIQIESREAPGNEFSLQVLWDLTPYGNAELQKVRAGNTDWATVILEENLADGWTEDTVPQFHEYARKFRDAIARAGAETILYMPWAAKDPGPPTTEEIAAAYHESGLELGVKVAPAGLAFQQAARARPDLELYAPDGYAPSGYGYYLAMCVLYGTIFDRNPVGLTYRMEDVSATGAGTALFEWPADWVLSQADAASLQKVAWDTVTDYKEQK
jgi:hypothetical protein